MRSSSSRSSPKRSNYSRSFELQEDQQHQWQQERELAADSRESEYGYGTVLGGAMLPVFLNDLRMNNEQDLVDVTLELDEDDSIVVCSVTPTTTGADLTSGRREDDAAAVTGIFGRSLSATSSRIRRKFGWLRSGSSKTRSSEDERERTMLSVRDARRMKAKLQRTRSNAQRALKGLRFISKTTTHGATDADELWKRVESRFNALAKDRLLAREDFGECIGMVDSKEFAVGIFDALARRRGQRIRKINKEELYDFWLQISDQSFDSRLQIFFDMADSNEDGRISRGEVQELLMLSASTNKLSKLKEQAEEYASLIMEELDPENLGYIEVRVVDASPGAIAPAKAFS